LEEVKRRIHFYDPPPPDFDVMTADPEKLKTYGIPPRPDAAQFPRLFAFWTEMFSPPLTFTEIVYSLMTDPVLISQLRISTIGKRESSSNWSGTYIMPRNGRQFTEVHGRWVVPGVTAPSGAPGGQEFRSSIWIGLDGQRRYFDSSLPQIGTAQFLNAPSDPPFSVWFQWWLRGNPNTYKPVTLSLPILAGHRMMASLTVRNDARVHFVILNRTTGVGFRPFTMDAPTDTSSGIQAKVSGATAEWILERPANAITEELYELPDYNQVQFTDCFAISTHGGSGLEQTLDGARLINMYKVMDNPPRTVTISKTEPPDVDRFKVTYIG
jgi:hypothetical protein